MATASETSAHLAGVLKPTTETIFHYTSPDGLLGIVESQSLWASEASSMNDIAEIEQGWAVVERLLKSKPPSEARDELLDIPTWARRQRPEVFLLSASTRRDDANQWQNYANGGRGYVVALDPHPALAVRSWAEEPTPHPKEDEDPGSIWIDFPGAVFVSPWRRAVYDETVLSMALDDLINEVPQVIERISLQTTYEDYAVQRQLEWAALWENLGQLALLYKPSGFSGENEVRATVTAITPAAHSKFRHGRTGVVSYLLVSSFTGFDGSLMRRPASEAEPPKGKLPIVEVVVGPGFDQDHIPSVERLLSAYDLDGTPVSRSELSLR